MNLTKDIVKYESGQMGDGETIVFFQNLIDTGLAWTLQGHYGRTAQALIEVGHCKLGKKIKDGVKSV